MNFINSVVIEGNVTRIGETKEFKNHTLCYTFPIATNYYYKTEEGIPVPEASFFNVRTFDALARLCIERCVKGKMIRVRGRLKQDIWKDSDGKTRSRMFIIAKEIEFAS